MTIDLLPALADAAPGHINIKDRQVAVDQNYCWRPIDQDTPRGTKLQLLGRGGVAVYSIYHANLPFWIKWAPLPSNGILDAAGKVVDLLYCWRLIDEHTPRGVKLQLLGRGGIEVYSPLIGKDDFWTRWAPLPNNPRDESAEAQGESS